MKKILVANRGEIAIRVIRACQELGIKTVAVHSTADKDALHAKLADESVCIGAGPSASSYLNIINIMSAAEICGVDAIHPGYGFLSESADFARICSASNITFIGPSENHIKTMGDKVRARSIATKNSVPLLPGSISAIKNLGEAQKIASNIGYPVIIKASAGGGGRGMKIVSEPEDLASQFSLAQKEALSGFGNSDCFIEKYLSNPKHIEVQIIGDQHGNLLHLGERECSMQRRHQKLLEEAPCITLSEEQRDFVTKAALRLARGCNYHSVGTVEFLFQDNEFYFMEMNTRIQVEHPVTELVFGVDLVKEQILIAQNKPLSFKQEDLHFNGHAIECRLNAEDPIMFRPCPGKIIDYHPPGGPGIRVDGMIYSGYNVPPLYDSLLAKLIVHDDSRDQCIARMKRALQETQLTGISSNIDFHLMALEKKSFQDGSYSTSFVSQHTRLT